MPVFADDDVVVHGDAEWRRDVDDRLRHLDVGLRWRRIAAWMIVDQDQSGRRQFERALDHLARIDRGMVDCAGLLNLVGDELIALVEEEEAKLLLVGKRHAGPAIVDHVVPG